MNKIFTLLALTCSLMLNAQTQVYETGQSYGDDWTGWTTPVTTGNVSGNSYSANIWSFTVSSPYTIETTRSFNINSQDIDIYLYVSSQNSLLSIEHSVDGTNWTSLQSQAYGGSMSLQTMIIPTVNPQAQNFYLKIKLESTGSPASMAAFQKMEIRADLGLPFGNTVSIAPTTSQNIQVGTNGTTITATESSTSDSREWKYSTTSGSGYGSFGTPETGITYTPNFASAGTYYVVCESTWGGSSVTSNEVEIVVSNSASVGELEMGTQVVYQHQELFFTLNHLDYMVEIYDVNGKLIGSQQNMKSFDLSNFEKGIYFVNIRDFNGNSQTMKIVK